MSSSVFALAQQLVSSDVAARREAAEGLAKLAESAAPAAAMLAQAASDSDEQVAQFASAALEELGPPPIEQLEPLAKILSDGPADTAYWAATLLGRLEAEGVNATPGLVHALNQYPAEAVKERAAWALGKIGHNDETVLAALRSAAADGGDSRLARLAKQALEQIDFD